MGGEGRGGLEGCLEGETGDRTRILLPNRDFMGLSQGTKIFLSVSLRFEQYFL
jgi:hypothetical protein